MTVHDPTRRTFLKAAGATGAVTATAGCLSGDDDGGDETDDETGGVDIDPGTQIVFDGQTPGWEGLEPSGIEGDQNPTIVLQAGEQYELGWSEGDGSTHNIEIRDADDEVVDDLSTEQTDDPGEDQILEFEASEEMAYYVCDPHDSTMRGEIRVE